MPLIFEFQVTLSSIELTCGHVIFVTRRFKKQRLADHEAFFCTACGISQHYPELKSEDAPPAKKSMGEKIVSIFKNSDREEKVSDE
jgi:hypothetical protein